MYHNNSNEPYLTDRDMLLVRLKDYDKKLSELDWRIFKIIVAGGISEEKEAKEMAITRLIEEYRLCISEDTAWRSIKSLVKIGLYDAVKMFTGYRNFNILILTDIGAQLYRLKNKKEPPIQEHKILKSQHASVLHGYMVKDTAAILKKKQLYKIVSTSRKGNLIKLHDGRTLIPDVIGMRENRSIDCYEVECGNHNQDDFNAKCNKLIAVSNRVFIIGQNRDRVTRILKPQIENWIKAAGKRHLTDSGVKVYLYSITDLAKDQVTYYYDMVSDEPVCCFKKAGEK